MKKNLPLLMVLLLGNITFVSAQKLPPYPNGNLDSLKREILALQMDIDHVKINLNESKNTLKTGILIATIGYTVTIIGGQLLGTEPELGEALLYAGGAIGVGGTVILVRGFNQWDFRVDDRR